MFEDRLRAVRISRGYTLQNIADIIEVDLRTYQRYEGGQSEPPFDTLVTLANLLDVPLDFLFGRDEYLKSLGVSVDVSLENPPRRPRPRQAR